MQPWWNFGQILVEPSTELFSQPKTTFWPPIPSLHLSPSSFNSFLHFSPTVLALGSSAIGKVLGHNDTFVFWGSLQQMAFASQKVLWSPKLFCTFVSESPADFGVNGYCFRKGSLEGSPTVRYIYLPVSSWGRRCMNCWHVSTIHIQSHHVVAVGVFFGPILFPLFQSYLLGGVTVSATLRLRHHKRRITLSGLAWLGDPLSTYWGKPKLYGKTHEKNWVKKIELAGGQREGGILWTKQQIGLVRDSGRLVRMSNQDWWAT